MQFRFRRPGGRSYARLSVPFVLCLLSLLGAGCASRQAAETSAAAANPRHGAEAAATGNLVNTSAIERSPAYRQAVLAFSGKDYHGALGRIDALLQTPDLSPSAQSYLHHQQALCRDAISGRKAPAATVAVSSGARPIRTAADADCGPRALLLVCQDMKIAASLPALRAAAGTTADGTTMTGLAKAAQSVGLKAEGVQMDRNALSSLTKPAIFWVDGNHYIAVLAVHHSLMDPSVNGDTATVHDPNGQREEEMPLGGPTGLLARSGGMLLVLSQAGKLAAATR